jgi:hypothetical protein
MNRQNDLHPFLFEQSVDTSVVIACFEAFSKTLKKKTVVVMDNASVHTSEEFEECLSQWKKQGLIIKYLPPYSPELNLIEILWRNITYTSYSQNIRTRLPAGGYAPTIAHTAACLPSYDPGYSPAIWTTKVAGERGWTGNTCWRISLELSIKRCWYATSIWSRRIASSVTKLKAASA